MTSVNKTQDHRQGQVDIDRLRPLLDERRFLWLTSPAANFQLQSPGARQLQDYTWMIHMIGLLIGIFASIPVGLAVNLASPWLQSKLAALNSTRRTRKIGKLRNDLQDIEEFRAGRLTNKFIARVVLQATYVLSFLIFSTLGIILALSELAVNGGTLASQGTSSTIVVQICIVLTVVALGVSGYAFASLAKLVDSVMLKHDRYILSIKRALHRLGARPEDTATIESTPPQSPNRE